MVPITFRFFRPQNPVPVRAVPFTKPVHAVPVHAVRTGSGSVRGHHEHGVRKRAQAPWAYRSTPFLLKNLVNINENFKFTRVTWSAELEMG